MTEAIIVAVITAAATITAQLIINAGTRARQEAIASAQQAVIIQRVTELEKKVDKHNCLVERMALAEASIKSAHKRLDDMKGAKHELESAT